MTDSNLAGQGAAPSWVHLVPAGTFSGSDGRGPYRLADPQAVIRASLARGKIPIDENHATDLAASSGLPSPARGWIVAMEMRGDGIWGRVDWTSAGASILEGRGYRGISPAFEADKSGTVLRVLRAALTNTPNLPQLATLHSRGNTHLNAEELRVCRIMNVDPAMLAAHRAVTAYATDHRSGDLQTLGGGYLSQREIDICKMLGIDPAKLLEKKLSGKFTSTIGGDGLTPEEYTISKALGIAPATLVALRGKETHAATAAGHGLTAEEERICKIMGIDPIKFAEHKQRRVSPENRQNPKAVDITRDDLGLSKEEIEIANKMGVDLKKLAEHKRLRAEKEKALDLGKKLGVIPHDAYKPGSPYGNSYR